MSATQRLLYHTLSGGSSSSSSLRPRSFIACFRLRPSCAVGNWHFFASPSLRTSLSAPDSTMPRYNRKGGSRDQWKEKRKSEQQPSSMETAAAAATDPATFTTRYGAMSTAVNCGQAQAHRVWKAKPYGTAASSAAPTENQSTDQLVAGMKAIGLETTAPTKNGSGLSKLFKAPPVEKFAVDNSTYLVSQIRATFYPKFENEKSDQEIRLRMIELVSKGLATLEVSLKHSGSLFMYSGHEGGAYAKNSYGNIYTAVGVFVLGRTFHEAWGTEAAKKQAEFNSFLEKNRMCISMELVTAVLGDHGQRPKEDYVVVTAVTELGNGKPKFFSTPEIIVFCRKWRLPTNHIWLFSTRKSATAFFAAYDALCEEGVASSVCKALDEIADISVPGSKDHVKVQGEILEGLVARIVTSESSIHMEKVMGDFLPPPSVGVDLELGSSLREICAAHRSDEKQQIKALLQSVGTSFCPNYLDWFGTDGCDSHSRNVDRSVLSKFLQAHPADFSTAKLQEMIRLMREKRFPAAFKCYHNFHKIDSTSNDDLYFKMAIHVHSDSAFRRYQREMRSNPGLWPLYRGFFVDLNLFRANKERTAKIVKNSNSVNTINGTSSISRKDSLVDEDANLMVKLKFLTYKLRTFLIRNGLTILLKDGPASYKAYYLRQMKIWGTSEGKQRELSQMLDEWAVYIRRKYGHKNLSSSVYLSEAEPFLEQYAKRSPRNQALIGSAGNLVRAEDFLAIIEGGRDEEGDLEKEMEVAPSTPIGLVKDIVPKVEGVIVFFPGIPGCAKSALCKELMSTSGDFGDDRPVRSLMGDLIKGRYWQRVADEHRKKPNSVMLADKNAPNEEVWKQIEEMCRRTQSSAVPVIPDSEGTDSNPFSLDALAVFLFRVSQRVNHPGNLDKESPNVGYVLLMFYHLYEGKNRKEFESSLIGRFGSVIKMPLLKPDRSPLPDPLKSTLEEGINLYHLHKCRHGRWDSTKGSYANEWFKWEVKLRKTLLSYAGHLNSIQVPFVDVVDQTRKQLTIILKGDYKIPSTEKRKVGTVVFAAVSLPVTEIQSGLLNLSATNPKVEAFLKDKNIETNLTKAHVTLAHKRSHGVTAVANYGVYLHQRVPVHLNALFFSEKMAAFEASLGSVDGEKINSKNPWPHVTLWTGAGVAAKDANILSQLHLEGKATRVDVNPPISLSGTLEFF